MGEYPVRIMVRASKELKELIVEEAAQCNRSRSYIIMRILEKHFQESATGVEDYTSSEPRSGKKPE